MARGGITSEKARARGRHVQRCLFTAMDADPSDPDAEKEMYMPRFEWESWYRPTTGAKERKDGDGKEGKEGEDPLCQRQVCMPGSIWECECGDKSADYFGQIVISQRKYKKNGKMVFGYEVKFDDGIEAFATEGIVPHLV